MARVVAPYGVKGWLKVLCYSAHSHYLKLYKRWWLQMDGGWQDVTVEQVKSHNQWLLMKWQGVNDRTFAGRYVDKELSLFKTELPSPADNEYYWFEIVGLRVFNQHDVYLGIVEAILETGANDVLIVRADNQCERMIPFIASVILSVDKQENIVRVDWEEDF